MKDNAKGVLAVGGMLVLSVLVAILIIQVAPAHFGIGHANELNWVSLVGATLGVVGTLGGLTVGIISITTLTQVEQRVSDAFERKYTEHSEQLNKQSSAWASGIRLWTNASMEEDLTKAQDLVEEALTYWPDAPDARTDMLRRLYEETEKAYVFDLIPGRRSSFEIYVASQGHGRYSPIVTEIPVSYLPDAAHWWALAWDRERPHNEEYLSYVGSKLAAQQDRLREATKYLQIWRQTSGKMRPWDRLIWAWCLHSEQDVLFLERVLGTTVSRPPEEIIKELRDAEGLAAVGVRHCLIVPRATNQRIVRSVGLVRNGDLGWDILGYEYGTAKRESPFLAHSDQECAEYLRQRYITVDLIPEWSPLPPTGYGDF